MKRGSWLALLAISLTLVLLLSLAAIHRRRAVHSAEVNHRDIATATPIVAAMATATAPPSERDHQRGIKIIESVYSAPINFYGQVRDQYGAPVPQARVDYSIIDKFFEEGSKKSGVTDDQGMFSLTGINGAALTVGVGKNGYAPIYGQSNGSFAYGAPFDVRRDRPSPTKDRPANFVLRKKSVAEALFVTKRDIAVPKDGAPIEISLQTLKQVPLGQGDLRIECWTFDGNKDSRGNYDWHARISVPGGGIVARTEPDREFEAPDGGYKTNIELNMPRNSVRWQRNQDGEYWVLLRSGTYARMRLRINTAGAHFATIHAFLNPSGSRNLEYDEEKIIK